MVRVRHVVPSISTYMCWPAFSPQMTGGAVPAEVTLIESVLHCPWVLVWESQPAEPSASTIISP